MSGVGARGGAVIGERVKKMGMDRGGAGERESVIKNTV